MKEPIEPLSDTERLAVALFGWEFVRQETDGDVDAYKLYDHKEHVVVEVYPDGSALKFCTTRPSADWPDLTDASLKYYWVRRMEDALAERGLLGEYCKHLVHMRHFSPSPIAGAPSTQAYALLCATTPQRVAAALRVLDGEGL